MAKRRKRTNAHLPAKGRLKEMADRLWSVAVRSDWNWKCAVCGSGPCDAHHLIPRMNQATRYCLRNGIALCRRHHQFCPELSPHQNAAGWLRWLSEAHPLRHQWYIDTVSNGEHLRFNGTTNAVYYCNLIRGFRGDVEDDVFQEIVGIKLSEYLQE